MPGGRPQAESRRKLARGLVQEFAPREQSPATGAAADSDTGGLFNSRGEIRRMLNKAGRFGSGFAKIGRLNLNS